MNSLPERPRGNIVLRIPALRDTNSKDWKECSDFTGVHSLDCERPCLPYQLLANKCLINLRCHNPLNCRKEGEFPDCGKEWISIALPQPLFLGPHPSVIAFPSAHGFPMQQHEINIFLNFPCTTLLLYIFSLRAFLAMNVHFPMRLLSAVFFIGLQTDFMFSLGFPQT